MNGFTCRFAQSPLCVRFSILPPGIVETPGLKTRKGRPKVFRCLRAGIKASVHTLKRENAKSTYGI